MESLIPHLFTHQMLTDSEAYVCQYQSTPPSQRAQELLKYLRHKGSGVLQKLLCCLKKDAEHSGHKDVAAKLIEAIEIYKFDNELTCPDCEPPKESISQKPDILDEMFAVIQVKCPKEKWEELANALELDESDIERIRTLSDTTMSVTLVLQRWKQMYPQTTREELIAKLYPANLEYLYEL